MNCAFQIYDPFTNNASTKTIEKDELMHFIEDAETNGYKDKLYLYLQLAQMILQKTDRFSLDLYEFMEKYYESNEVLDNIFILKFIYYVYLQCCHSDFNDIWFASSRQLCFYGTTYGMYASISLRNHLCDDLKNITLMRYRTHCRIAECEITHMISKPENKNERYRHIVDIVRKCINDEYDLSIQIPKIYKTRTFGNYFEEKYDEIYQITCPTYYDPNNHCNFKLLREDIDMKRSKRFLVNTVLIELRAMIDLHIDMEHENEIHAAINTICKDKNLSIYILPHTQELLDNSYEFFMSISIIHVNSKTGESDSSVALYELKGTLREISRLEGNPYSFGQMMKQNSKKDKYLSMFRIVMMNQMNRKNWIKYQLNTKKYLKKYRIKSIRKYMKKYLMKNTKKSRRRNRRKKNNE